MWVKCSHVWYHFDRLNLDNSTKAISLRYNKKWNVFYFSYVFSHYIFKFETMYSIWVRNYRTTKHILCITQKLRPFVHFLFYLQIDKNGFRLDYMEWRCRKKLFTLLTIYFKIVKICSFLHNHNAKQIQYVAWLDLHLAPLFRSASFKVELKVLVVVCYSFLAIFCLSK